ncbi:MAG: hypothetical protein F7B59_03010 [Desulfurococcales archaeon]|nr:hypothetical protein [Desulfurococcales archaeon]
MTRKDTVVILVIIALMLLVRVPLAPYTSGSDIAQFAGFADTFLRHHLCFYNYVAPGNSASEGWPYSWPYVYGPGLILVLSPLRKLASSEVIHYYDENGYHVFIPSNWIVATKSVFISFDVLSAVLVYLILRHVGYNSKKAALVTSLYAFNPVTIYISSIYGMFDQIPLFFFLAGIYLFYLDGTSSRGKLVGSFLIGLSVGFKPTFLIPFLAIFYDNLVYRKPVNAGILASLLLGVIVLFTPFLVACPKSMATLIETMFSNVKPTYTFPISYDFNGISNLATYIYEHTGRNLYPLITYWWIPTIILIAVELFAYNNYRDALVFSSTSYIIFMATYWRVNYQYLVPAVAFTIIILSRLHGSRRIKALGLTYISLIGLWYFMFPVSWWTHVHILNPNTALWHALDRFSLMIFNEEPYLLYSLILTIVEYLLSIEVIIYMASSKVNMLTGEKWE